MNKEKIIESLENLFNNSFNSIKKLEDDIFCFYYSRYKYVNQELIEHNLNIPHKFFKRKYNNWLKEKKDLENEKKEILNKLKDFYIEFKK